jgi:hypothetical protein
MGQDLGFHSVVSMARKSNHVREASPMNPAKTSPGFA